MDERQIYNLLSITFHAIEILEAFIYIWGKYTIFQNMFDMLKIGLGMCTF